jgi:D-glycero-D-manno-heptose 1,7-bisphosphate phosphatase
MNRPALFLDRDGVINVDHGYVHMQEAVEFVGGIFELVAVAKQQGYVVVVVTNQAGIGRGYYTEAHFHALMDWMKLKFVDRQGKIDAVYFCPYHPEHGIGEYRRESEFRKPAPGMLLQAQRELGIDMERSIFIGDTLTDMAAGRVAGVGTLLHLNGEKAGDDTIVITQLSEALPYLRSPAR